MFTKEDLKCIDPSYFHIIQAGGLSVTLQSKNTGHYWHILYQEGKGFSTCQIYHKHNFKDAFHQHRNRPDISAALEHICSHDAFHLKRQKRKRPA